MAEILTQRALVLADIETVFGTLVTPSATTDALLAQEPDFSVDITTIERNFARQSISPLPIAAGRKVASMTFNHEIRSNGSFDGSTPPRVGKLLRGCGLAETAITTNGVTNGRNDFVADSGNGGDDPFTTPTANAGSNALIDECDYHIRVTIGGASTTAAVRVTGGCRPADDQTDSSQEKDAVFTETFCVETVLDQGGITGSSVIDDTTDPESVDYDFTGLGSLTIGDQFRVTVLGIPFLVTVTVATPTGLGDDVEAAVDAHPDFVAANVAGVVTVTFTGNAASTVLTSATTVVSLGASGHTVQVGAFASLTLNDFWTATTRPTGTEYEPVSTSFESLSIFMYFDGLLHKMSGSRGTFTAEGTGGELGIFGFEFQGNYIDVIDAALPAAVFESQIPQQVELAALRIGSLADDTVAPTVGPSGGPVVCDSWNDQINGVTDDLCASAFSFDMGNSLTPRACINEADAFKGVIITSRQATGSLDPEVELVATHDFWGLLAAAAVLSYKVQVGTTRGNIVRFLSDSVQYAGMSYGDREGLRTLEADLRFSASAPNFSDDEIKIAFN